MNRASNLHSEPLMVSLTDFTSCVRFVVGSPLPSAQPIAVADEEHRVPGCNIYDAEDRARRALYRSNCHCSRPCPLQTAGVLFPMSSVPMSNVLPFPQHIRLLGTGEKALCDGAH